MLQIEQLVKLYAPHKCQFCPEVGAPICETCVDSITTQVSSSCVFCNRLTLDFKVCGACRKKHKLKRAWVAGRYEGKLKDAVWDYKFHRKRAYARSLAHLISSPIHEMSFDFVSWVPTAPLHRQRRGYDHARLLAKFAARELGVATRPTLVRTGSKRQVGTKRKERWEQARQQFALKRRASVDNQRILLIDDVVTSGATLAACATILRTSGARLVEAALIAKD